MKYQLIILLLTALGTMFYLGYHKQESNFLSSTNELTSNKIQNPIIYEISLRPWLYELSQKYGRKISKLNDIPFSEFENLKSLGVHYVWLMGIWELGQYGVAFDRSNPDQINFFKQLLPDFTIEDVIGSPYAITEFRCNPDIGTDSDIIELKRKLNNLGLKLMLDFVPNHSAVDSVLVDQHPEYYIHAPKGSQPPYDRTKYLENGIAYGKDMYDSPWMDTAQWNYWNPDTRTYLKGVVNKIASMSDGMRCDMAMVILNDLYYAAWQQELDSWGYGRPSQEFWHEAISEAKQKYPDVIFLAEVYWDKEQDLINQGFDYVYEKKLLDTLATLKIDDIRNNINSIQYDYAIHSNRFVENHDEVRAVEKFHGKDYIANVAAMLSYTLPGAKFINHGQLQGYANKLDVHLRRARVEHGSDYSRSFYKQLIPIISRDVFRNGQWQRLQVQGIQAWKFFAWKLVNSSEKIVCVINFSEGQGYAKIKLPDAQSGQQTIVELMSGKSYDRNGESMKYDGLEVVVDGWNG